MPRGTSRHLRQGLSLRAVPEKGQQIPNVGTATPCVAVGSGQGWAASWTAAAWRPHLGWAWPQQVLQCEAPARPWEVSGVSAQAKWPQLHPWVGASQVGLSCQVHRGSKQGRQWSPGSRVQVPGHFTQQARPGPTGAQGWQHGPVLTGRLAVGFLAVRAVVDVDVWGLLLFHSHTAETEEAQMLQVPGAFPVGPGQLLSTSQEAGSMHAGGTGQEPGQRPTRTGGGMSRGVGRGKEGLAVHDQATQRDGPSHRPACRTATTVLSPQSRGPRGSRRGLPPPRHHGQLRATGRALRPLEGLPSQGAVPRCRDNRISKD